MHRFFNIGDVINGFCSGYFGRDDYDSKMCVMITEQYAVFQWLDGEFKDQATVLNNPERLNQEMVDGWKNSMEIGIN